MNEKSELEKFIGHLVDARKALINAYNWGEISTKAFNALDKKLIETEEEYLRLKLKKLI